jgi:hypothetical protein
MSSNTISTGFDGSRRGIGGGAARLARRRLIALAWLCRRIRRRRGFRGTIGRTRPRRFVLEEIAEAILAEPRRPQNQVDLNRFTLFRPLAGVENDVGAVRAPRNIVGVAVRHRADGPAFASGGSHRKHVPERLRRQTDVCHPPAVRRPRESPVRSRQVSAGQRLFLLRREVQEPQLFAVAHERNRFSIGRNAWR